MKALVRSSIAALALAGVTVASVQAPARADSAATTRTIIGAAAAIAGIATAINLENKHRQATTVVGYLSDGSTVYADGHVVARNGYSWYPGNQGEKIACNGQQCSVYSNGQYGYNGSYNNGGYYNNNGYYNGYSTQSTNVRRGRGHHDRDNDGGGVAARASASPRRA